MDLPPYLRLSQCLHGPMLYNMNFKLMGPMLDRYGECFENEIALLRQLLTPGMTAIDAGAAIGTHTVPLAKIVGPTGRVVSLEPQRHSFQLLCANVALNGLANVDPRRAAAGRSAGKIVVPVLDPTRRWEFGVLELGKHERGDEVPLLALDQLDLPRCDLVKIDVEGMEGEVLAGGQALIARHRPLLYVENDRPNLSPALIAQLWDLDYDCYWHLAYYVRFPNFRGETENLFPQMGAANMLCVPRERPATISLRKVAKTDEQPYQLLPPEN